MIKSYFLKYGSKLNKLEIKEFLEIELDISFTEHDSAYLGIYFNYSGLYADRLSIFDNHVSTPYQKWLYEDNKQFCSLIEISIAEGKNKDKLSKCKYIRNICNQNIFSIISEKCFEE